MYMAVLSFQNTSCKARTNSLKIGYRKLTFILFLAVFFTYMPNAPVTVYGVANLLLSLVSVGGIIIFITVG